MDQDAALSRRKREFNSPRGYGTASADTAHSPDRLTQMATQPESSPLVFRKRGGTKDPIVYWTGHWSFKPANAGSIPRGVTQGKQKKRKEGRRMAQAEGGAGWGMPVEYSLRSSLTGFVAGWLKLGLAVAMRGPLAADELAWGGT